MPPGVLLEALPTTSPSPVPAFGANLISVSFLCSTMIWAPVLAAFLVATLPNPRNRYDGALRWIAFWTLTGLLVVNLFTYFQFQTFGTAVQFEEKAAWLPRLGVTYHLGLDGLGMGVLLLSSIVGAVAVVASWGVRTRVRAYYVLLLLLQAAVNGVIVSRDLFVLGLFLSAAVLPATLLVLGWGGPARARAGARLLGYWGAGSLALWIAIFTIYAAVHGSSFDLDDVFRGSIPMPQAIVAGVAVLVAAACWLPIVPFHGWFRDAVAESPAGVAVLITGSATRLGPYVLLRILFLGQHDAAVKLGAALSGLAAATAIYAGVLALIELRARGDVRRAAAALAMLPGAVTVIAVAGQTPLAFTGAVLTLYGGGLAAALLVGAAITVSDRAETRSLAAIGGIGLRAPVLGWLAVLAVLAVLGFPGFASFLGTLLTFMGAIRNEPGGTFGVVVGLAVGAAAAAGLVGRIVFGPPAGEGPAVTESTLTERTYLVALVVALLWVGIVPSGPKLAGVPILDPGFVNVANATTSSEAGAYAVPAPKP
jgi:proton-translocating NADH-quinone oxidoreductase chain M